MTRFFKTAILLGAATAFAHEIQDNRATLVLRDGGHLSVTLYISYAEALHLALAPQRPMAEFLMVYSAMKPDQFRKELLRAQAKFEASTQVYLGNGTELALARWAWPDPQQVQDMFRHRIMQLIADPSAHVHDEPLEVHADAVSAEAITAVRVQFPEEFQKVLVVAYRPNQYWVDARAWSPNIRF